MSTLLVPAAITNMIQTPASNPSPSITNYVNDNHDDFGFEFSDFLAFADQPEDDYACSFTALVSDSPVILQDNHTSTESSMNSNHDDDMQNTHVLQMLVNTYFTNICYSLFPTDC